ncbi:DUF6083 domain-containing protein [Streptomyces sp. CA-132043]|uniref:DUF6083 domain-containing protein n=1 Tax=Streptomyces sp. CA-132043 TaxID=3240048 RepID=UPI003D93FCE7
MHPATPASDRHWDGSPHRPARRRSLRVAPTSPNRLLRTGQCGYCRHCGHRLEWFHTSTDQPIALHPAEVATAAVPASGRWHLSCGTAYPGEDGSRWCRIPHTLLCPHHPAPRPLSRPLRAARSQLALRTRRRLDAGTFNPAPPTSVTTKANAPAPCRPARPVLQLFRLRYLATGPVDAIRCVAQTRNRRRCPHPVLAPAFPGTWALLPAGPVRGQLALPHEVMAVYDLSHLPYAEQLRWRAQRCPAHAAAPGAADVALPDWEVFDPLLHHEHIHTRLPNTIRRRPR